MNGNKSLTLGLFRNIKTAKFELILFFMNPPPLLFFSVQNHSLVACDILRRLTLNSLRKVLLQKLSSPDTNQILIFRYQLHAPAAF